MHQICQRPLLKACKLCLFDSNRNYSLRGSIFCLVCSQKKACELTRGAVLYSMLLQGSHSSSQSTESCHQILSTNIP